MKRANFDNDNVLAVFTDKGLGNLGFHLGSLKGELLKNKEFLMKELGLRELVWMNQVHGNKVEIVSGSKRGLKNERDGMITAEKGLALMVAVADCLPILFYDPNKRVIGVAHAGREGVFKNIVAELISKMIANFGVNPKNILVSVGPGIQACCYDFKGVFLDLPKMVREQLIEAGVLGKNIEIFPICTKCDANYFSYRRNKKTGRFAGVIMLK